MNAMVLEQIAPVEQSPLRWKEVPEPQPASNQVRVRVSCCAVCRTDIHVIVGDLPDVHLPIIPGHQIVGVVDAIGSDVSNLKIGERVGIAWLQKTCGRCRFCTTSRENL